MKVEPNFDECKIVTIDKEYKEKINQQISILSLGSYSKVPNNLNKTKISQILACLSHSQFEIQTHYLHKSHR